MSPSTGSSNTADLLLHFHNQKAKHDGPHIEVGTVPKHLLEDIEQCLPKFSFTRDEILDHINDVWPQIGTFITTTGDEHGSFEDELFQEKSDNCQLQDEIDDLNRKIKTLEIQLESLHIHNTTSERSLTLTSPIDITSSNIAPHPLASLEKWTYSQKHPHKLDKNSSFINKVLKPIEQPDYWLLHIWNTGLSTGDPQVHP
ncbi:hypothetical protein M422DRAFT_252719 [Sphaerobolus stellatus SS14]|uniref:Uncharacterized protein n=1 Tax=Sphaerobolus stellatus (strain SS14) TaxID=990650 RepID=A0A0C9UL90_SPHS4|nr:hypothetical protein M422DRAFT_252719 [Sphaerobolus stellatus SS14]